MIKPGIFNISIDSSSLNIFSCSFSHLLQIIERSNVFLSKIYDILGFLKFLHLPQITQSRPILQRNGKKRAKNCLKRARKVKIFKNLAKNTLKLENILKNKKGLVIVCDTLIIARNKLLEKALII